jgi:UDP-N-acetylmuramyl tripeptide synthase
MKTLLSLSIGKLTNATIKEFSLGSGSTWPGHMALKIQPDFIKKFLDKKNLKVILIAGTNGKTTTGKLLSHILEKNEYSVFQNEEGANMLNGIGTTLLRNSTLWGKIRGDVAIFEVDENNLPKVLEQITPTAIVFLNLFRDQLDRYGEIHTIAEKWKHVLKKLPATTKIILNADDPEIRHLIKEVKGKTFYFSIPTEYFQKKESSHDVDSSHCPNCGTKLQFSKIAYSHIGKYFCKNCKFSNENISLNPEKVSSSNLSGTYNLYNIQAAIKTAKEIFEIPSDNIADAVKNFIPAFGRQEKLKYKNRDILMLLSKNPAGFNQSLSVVLESKSPTVLLSLNDRIPDGKDVSWIWDIDTDPLVQNAHKIIVTGDRAHDMALRLKYSSKIRNPKSEIRNMSFDSQHGRFQIQSDTKKAVNEFVKNIKEGETGYILPTYSAMLEIRKITTGKEIL